MFREKRDGEIVTRRLAHVPWKGGVVRDTAKLVSTQELELVNPEDAERDRQNDIHQQARTSRTQITGGSGVGGGLL